MFKLRFDWYIMTPLSCAYIFFRIILVLQIMFYGSLSIDSGGIKFEIFHW